MKKTDATLATLRDALQWPSDIRDRLKAFADLFLRWNQQINLSAARTLHELDEHIADCLHIVPHVVGASRLVDVGAGGGLPSAIIAISLPSVHVMALEPVHKKQAFLRTAARELRLANYDALAERDETHNARYDMASSRATFDLDEWIARGARLAPKVLAMEGIARPSLPPGAMRHEYEFFGKSRAIVVWQQPCAGGNTSGGATAA